MSKISVVREISSLSPQPLTEVELEKLSPASFNSVETGKPKTMAFRTKVGYSIRNFLLQPQYFWIFALARFRVARQIYAFCSKFKSPIAETSDRTESLFELDPVATVEILKQDGVCTGLNLPSPFLNDLQQYLHRQYCYAGGKTHLGFKIDDKQQLDQLFPKPFYVARYFNLSRNCPQIERLVNDPKLQQIAKGYIGSQAQYTGASLFWTFPIEGKSTDDDQQMFSHFHYDIDDFAGLRFCFYLTDVALDNGPHVCIQGSHIQKKIRHILNFFSRIQTTPELKQTYDEEKFLTISGAAGSGFMEDTFCFHKGNPPQNKPRLFLQLHFATHNYDRHHYLDDRHPATLQSWRESLTLN